MSVVWYCLAKHWEDASPSNCYFPFPGLSFSPFIKLRDLDFHLPEAFRHAVATQFPPSIETRILFALHLESIHSSLESGSWETFLKSQLAFGHLGRLKQSTCVASTQPDHALKKYPTPGRTSHWTLTLLPCVAAVSLGGGYNRRLS